MEKLLIVNVPVANLRRKPVDATLEYVHDDLQETQVLYNEVLLYKDENKDWYYVEAIEQQEFTHSNIWQGYPGWVRKKSARVIDKYPEYDTVVVKNKIARILHSPSETAGVLLTLSIGTRLWIKGKEASNEEYYQVELIDRTYGWVKKEDVNIMNKRVSEDQIREKIVNTGKLFLGVPYLWGGRSMYIPELQFGVHPKPEARNQKLQSVATGVDCSGLTNLVYRVNNIDVPRDAHEQWMKSEHITSEELKTGDLLFVSTEGNIHSINHVMLYMGGEQFIEVSETGSFVRLNTLREKFGIGISKLAQHHFLVDNKKIYCGRVISAGF